MKERLKWSWPGHRTIKTGVAVVACVIFYNMIGRDGVMMAVTAAMICMQDSVEKSISSGKSRIIATLMGGGLGALCVAFRLTEMGEAVFALIAFLGVVLLIHSFHILKITQSTVISCIVFLNIITTAVAATAGTEVSPVAYSVNRTIDTLIGIMVSVFINISMFRPAERVEGQPGPSTPVDYIIVKKEHSRISKWSGGTTTELFIYPEDTFYSDKNFDFRISTATVAAENSVFTKLPGFKRYIMALEGSMILEHEGYHSIELGPFEKDFFLGDWVTKSSGKCADFNLMAGEGYTGAIDPIESGYTEKLSTKTFNGFYCVADGCLLEIESGGAVISETLQKGDFISFDYGRRKPEKTYMLKLINSVNSGIIAVKASVWKQQGN